MKAIRTAALFNIADLFCAFFHSSFYNCRSYFIVRSKQTN